MVTVTCASSARRRGGRGGSGTRDWTGTACGWRHGHGWRRWRPDGAPGRTETATVWIAAMLNMMRIAAGTAMSMGVRPFLVAR